MDPFKISIIYKNENIFDTCENCKKLCLNLDKPKK